MCRWSTQVGLSVPHGDAVARTRVPNEVTNLLLDAVPEPCREQAVKGRGTARLSTPTTLRTGNTARSHRSSSRCKTHMRWFPTRSRARTPLGGMCWRRYTICTVAGDNCKSSQRQQFNRQGWGTHPQPSVFMHVHWSVLWQATRHVLCIQRETGALTRHGQRSYKSH